MRQLSRSSALLAVVLGACRTPSARSPVPAEAALVAPAPLSSSGMVERPHALASFFTALARLEDGSATDDVRIVAFGDSHTSSDWETGPVRRQLQARFGDGGRGFVPIGRPWKAWSQEGVLTGTAGWTTQMQHPASRHASGDGIFGLSGIALATQQPGADTWVHVLAATSRVELDYLEQPGGGSFDLFVDGLHRARIPTRAEVVRGAQRTVDVTEGAPHRIEARALGNGEVRLFGVALDRAKHGIVLDALGVNGASIATPLAWREDSWSEDLRHRAPSLVVVAYGTNDAADLETPLATFESGFAEVLARIRRAVPSTSCLVLGPPDRAGLNGKTWTTPSRLVEVVAREKRAADDAGCGFFDRMAAMGGEGAMARWAKGPLFRGQQDRVHLTRDGYAAIGSAFVSELLREYDLWRAR